MAARIKSPSNFKKLTNISVVRLKRGGKVFELACYPNKVTSWREGVEKDLDEVLQQRLIFSNVSKGVQAKQSDVSAAFPSLSDDEVINWILTKGVVQVTEKERAYKSEQLLKDIATGVVQRCVDKDSKQPLTVGIIERALKEIRFQPSAAHSAKKQTLEAIKALEAVMPIERARLRARIVVPARHAALAKAKLEPMLELIEDQQSLAGSLTILAVFEPGNCRAIAEFLENDLRGAGTMSLLGQITVADEEETTLV